MPTGAFVARRNGKVFITGNSGFPKSLDVSAAIDRAAGAERKRIRGVRSGVVRDVYAQDAWSREFKDSVLSPDPITAAARQWQGWHTALKPAAEYIVLARKPCADVTSEELWQETGWDHWCSSKRDGEDKIVTGRALHPEARSYRARVDKDGREVSREDLGAYEQFAINAVAANVLRHGTGALNIDASRVACPHGDEGDWPITGRPKINHVLHDSFAEHSTTNHAAGRWPPNVLHDGSDEVLDAFARFGERQSRPGNSSSGGRAAYGGGWKPTTPSDYVSNDDTGSAARFFPALSFAEDELRFIYEAKADASQRAGTTHVTVKPIAVMEWLIKLITPRGGTVLDPFAGSLTTLIAAERLGFNAIGIELDETHIREGEERMRRHRARRAIGKAERAEALPGQLGLFDNG